MGEINFFPDDLEIKDQKIILRLDLNVPIKDKVIKDDTRITLCLPFINRLIEKKAKIIIISHLGRPKGINVPDLSLIPIYKYLKDALKTNVYFFRGTFDGETKEKFSHLKGGEVILIENIRFFKEETEDGQDFSKKLGELGDIYINDAFSCSHRKQASVHSITKFVKKSYAGPLLKKEITAINLVIKNKKGKVWDIPQNLYSPIKQDVILLKDGEKKSEARLFLKFLSSRYVKEKLNTLGYVVN